jgi:predicted transcriptional regulator
MNKRVLLVSVHPEYAEKLLAGIKTIELRKVKPNLKTGDKLVIYATSPIKAVVGICNVEAVLSDAPYKLWKKVSKHAGISKSRFDSYYDGHENAFGIVCSEPKSMKQPIGLDELRQRWRNFTPPQSYKYIELADMHKLEEWGECATTGS